MLKNRYRAKAIWDFEGIFCSSRHIPHVRFAGLIHPGILGCAPSAEVLAEWNRREGELVTTHAHLDRVVAKPPEPVNVHAGSAGGDIKAKVGREGARTIPVSNVLNPEMCKSVRTAVPTKRQSYRAAPSTAGTATSKTSAAAARYISQCTFPAPNSPSATCTSRRAMAKSPSAAPSRWPA